MNDSAFAALAPIAMTTQAENIVAEALYYRYFEQAEAVRWRVSDIPWERLEPAAVSPYWTQVVTEIARSELTTFDGTRQFMARFGDDPDFSQWLAVWLYEETKHPQVLMMWLGRMGVKLDEQFLVAGRQSAQFAASWLGTLTLNVIAEVMAAEAYATLARHAPEPVLRHLAWRISADEARHAAHFFGYGQRLVARSHDLKLELKNSLEVLYLWLNTQTRLEHPIGQIMHTVEGTAPFRAGVRDDGFVTDALRERICTIIGRMIGIPLTSKKDVLRAARELGRTPR
jgi:Ferritin-like domain